MKYLIIIILLIVTFALGEQVAVTKINRQWETNCVNAGVGYYVITPNLNVEFKFVARTNSIK